MLLEPCWSEHINTQGLCRVDRPGQHLTTHLYLLLDPENKAEMTVRNRQLSHVALDTGAWGVVTGACLLLSMDC